MFRFSSHKKNKKTTCFAVDHRKKTSSVWNHIHIHLLMMNALKANPKKKKSQPIIDLTSPSPQPPTVNKNRKRRFTEIFKSTSSTTRKKRKLNANNNNNNRNDNHMNDEQQNADHVTAHNTKQIDVNGNNDRPNNQTIQVWMDYTVEMNDIHEIDASKKSM